MDPSIGPTVALKLNYQRQEVIQTMILPCVRRQPEELVGLWLVPLSK